MNHIAQNRQRINDGPPEPVRAINDMIRHLGNSIARNHGIFTRSMEGQVLGLLSHWLRERLAGNDCVRPGIQQMAKWGRCSERQAQRNLRQMEQWGVVRVAADGHGGRSMRPALTVHIDMLMRALTALAMKMSKALIAKITAFFETPVAPEKGDKKGDTVSPAYREDTHTASRPPLSQVLLASIWGRYQPPRRSKRLNVSSGHWMRDEDRSSNPYQFSGDGVRP